MALTPEDVVNKRFQATKFREGYDQDEVDDFLDEVVVELRRLSQENEELRQRVTTAEARASDAEQSHAAAPVAAAAAAPAPAVYTEPAAQPATVAVPTQAPAGAGTSQSELDEQTSTTNLLQLARRLHEEHVREGVEKRDALIAEGHATAARVVAEAEAKQRAQMGILDQERVALEKRVDGLRVFEREYRQKLKGYIEGQLRDLDNASPVTPPANQGYTAPVSAGGSTDSAPSPTYQGFGG